MGQKKKSSKEVKKKKVKNRLMESRAEWVQSSPVRSRSFLGGIRVLRNSLHYIECTVHSVGDSAKLVIGLLSCYSTSTVASFKILFSGSLPMILSPSTKHFLIHNEGKQNSQSQGTAISSIHD